MGNWKKTFNILKERKRNFQDLKENLGHYLRNRKVLEQITRKWKNTEIIYWNSEITFVMFVKNMNVREILKKC